MPKQNSDNKNKTLEIIIGSQPSIFKKHNNISGVRERMYPIKAVKPKDGKIHNITKKEDKG